MKKRFTLLIAMMMLLTAIATNVFASSANNNSKVSPKEWQEWFNGLSKEEQLSVNYEPASANNNPEVSPKELQEWFNGLSKEEKLSVNYELLQSIRLSDKDIEWLKWYNTLSKEEQLAVNYFPSQLLKLFSSNEVSKVNNDVFAISKDPNIYIHNQIVKTDVVPFIKNERTMVPLRIISENLGYNVQWNQKKQEVKVSDRNLEVKLYIGKKEIINNNHKEVIDVAPLIKNDRTFVPLRCIAEAFNQVVIWDQKARNVHITREKDIPSNKNDYIGRFVLINSIDVSSSKGDKKSPESLRIGDVGLILKSEGDYLYIDLIKPQGEAIEDWSFAKGYVLKKDCILNPRPNELDLISNVCRLKNGQIKVQDSINGETYEVDGNRFANIKRKEKNQLLIEMPGGANSAWVSKNDVDFVLEYFTGNLNN